MTVLLSERSQIFQGADAYAVSDYVNQHVGSHCIRLPPKGRPQASISHRTFSSLDLCRISYGAPVRVTSVALETIYHLQILLSGHCRSHSRGVEHVFGPGEILLINPDDPVDLTYSANAKNSSSNYPYACSKTLAWSSNGRCRSRVSALRPRAMRSAKWAGSCRCSG